MQLLSVSILPMQRKQSSSYDSARIGEGRTPLANILLAIVVKYLSVNLGGQGSTPRLPRYLVYSPCERPIPSSTWLWRILPERWSEESPR